MVFLSSKMPSIDTTLDNPPSEGIESTSPLQQYQISPSSSVRKSSTSTIINSFDSSDDPSSPLKSQPLSLAFLHKKRRVSDPIIDIPSPTSILSASSSEVRLIRKKSGELVKSSLKLNQLGATSKSMPNTPIFKNVHFGQAVDVKYFDGGEKPSAISAQNSPTLRGLARRKKRNSWGSGAVFQFDKNDHGNDEDDDDDDDDDDSDDEEDDDNQNWDIEIMNFGKIRYNEKFASKSLIFLESITLSPEKDSIFGIIAVKNKSFQKNVHLRYTFDNWKTVIEIECNFENDFKSIPRILKRNDYDRFKFKLELKSFNFLVNKENNHTVTNISLKFCIRYSFNDLEIWDNNENKNYEINLIHRPKFAHEKFSLNDSDQFEVDPKSTDQSNSDGTDDYFSYKKHGYDFTEPVPDTDSSNKTIDTKDNPKITLKNNSSDNSYELNLSSPDTPKILKDDSYKKFSEPDEEISLDSVVQKSKNFVNSNEIRNTQQYNQISDSLNKLSLFNDKNDENVSPLNNKVNVSSPTTNPISTSPTDPENPLIFGRKPSTDQGPNRTYTVSPNANTNTFSKLPSMNSKSYQELIDAYCFFKGNEDDSDIIQSDLNPNLNFVNTIFKPSYLTDENNAITPNTKVEPKKEKPLKPSPSTVSSYLNNVHDDEWSNK